MFRIRKQFSFEAAHVLGKAFSVDCESTIHGHSYVVEIFLCSDECNDNGMVLDFGRLKGLFTQYDHAIFLPREKKDAINFDMNARVIVINDNPTAEWMAKHFYQQVQNKLNSAYPELMQRIILEKVRVHETVTGWAEYAR